MGSAEQVKIEPSDLRFRMVLNKQLLATISISNPLFSRVAFKIKTTAPKKYVVRPSSGVVEPKASLNVQVIMQAQKEYPPDFQNCRDKFMIQVTPLAEHENLDKDTFNKETRHDMQEHRLRVVMEGPAAPPSPVPEAAEGEAGEQQQAAAAPSAQQPAADGMGLQQDAGALKLQLERVKREREDLRKKLDEASLKGGAAGAKEKAGAAALKSRVSIVHIILVAIIAFLIGHFTRG